jgi:hypothetical protein
MIGRRLRKDHVARLQQQRRDLVERLRDTAAGCNLRLGRRTRVNGCQPLAQPVAQRSGAAFEAVVDRLAAKQRKRARRGVAQAISIEQARIGMAEAKLYDARALRYLRVGEYGVRVNAAIVRSWCSPRISAPTASA